MILFNHKPAGQRADEQAGSHQGMIKEIHGRAKRLSRYYRDAEIFLHFGVAAEKF